MSDQILVTGATGNVGSQVVAELLRAGANVRAAVRSNRDIGTLNPNLIVVADANDSSSLEKACRGIDRLFLLPPFIPDMASFCQAWVEAAKNNGVRHIVKLSALGCETERITLFREHRAGERVVEESGIAWTFLRPNSFHQNFIAFNAQSIREGNQFFLPMGQAAWSTVDTNDIGAVAASVLTKEEFQGRSLDVTGPESLTNPEIANLFSAVLGREIRYVPVSDEAAYDGMLAGGMPEWPAKAVLELYQYMREGNAAAVADTVPTIRRGPAIFFKDFVTKNRRAFS